jgi:hypothetical protein
MAELTEEKKYNALNAYGCVTLTLEARNLKFEKYDDELVVRCGFDTDTFPLDLTIYTLAEEEAILILSKLPFEFPEERGLECAFAVSAINCNLKQGSFDYNFIDREIRFRLSTSYCGTDVHLDLCNHLINYSAQTIKKYSDLLYLLATEALTFEQFMMQVYGF